MNTSGKEKDSQTFDFEGLALRLVDEVRNRLLRADPSEDIAPSAPQENWRPEGDPEKDPAILAAMIDHTLLKSDATPDDIRTLCREARENHFATVCVNSSQVTLAHQCLEGSDVKTITVVGFPLGAASTASKAFESQEAIRAGAREIDMVINVGALKSKDYGAVLEDIRGVVKASGPYPVKVILETAALTLEEKISACTLAKVAGAAFVKTSTGFGPGGATVEDVALMRKVVGPKMGVKASGGIRTREDALKMIAAGADRIGASASVAIVHGKSSPSGDKY